MPHPSASTMPIIRRTRRLTKIIIAVATTVIVFFLFTQFIDNSAATHPSARSIGGGTDLLAGRATTTGPVRHRHHHSLGSDERAVGEEEGAASPLVKSLVVENTRKADKEEKEEVEEGGKKKKKEKAVSPSRTNEGHTTVTASNDGQEVTCAALDDTYVTLRRNPTDIQFLLPIIETYVRQPYVEAVGQFHPVAGVATSALLRATREYAKLFYLRDDAFTNAVEVLVRQEERCTTTTTAASNTLGTPTTADQGLKSSGRRGNITFSKGSIFTEPSDLDDHAVGRGGENSSKFALDVVFSKVEPHNGDRCYAHLAAISPYVSQRILLHDTVSHARNDEAPSVETNEFPADMRSKGEVPKGMMGAIEMFIEKQNGAWEVEWNFVQSHGLAVLKRTGWKVGGGGPGGDNDQREAVEVKKILDELAKKTLKGEDKPLLLDDPENIGSIIEGISKRPPVDVSMSTCEKSFIALGHPTNFAGFTPCYTVEKPLGGNIGTPQLLTQFEYLTSLEVTSKEFSRRHVLPQTTNTNSGSRGGAVHQQEQSLGQVLVPLGRTVLPLVYGYYMAMIRADGSEIIKAACIDCHRSVLVAFFMATEKRGTWVELSKGPAEEYFPPTTSTVGKAVDALPQVDYVEHPKGDFVVVNLQRMDSDAKWKNLFDKEAAINGTLFLFYNSNPIHSSMSRKKMLTEEFGLKLVTVLYEDGGITIWTYLKGPIITGVEASSLASPKSTTTVASSSTVSSVNQSKSSENVGGRSTPESVTPSSSSSSPPLSSIPSPSTAATAIVSHAMPPQRKTKDDQSLSSIVQCVQWAGHGMVLLYRAVVWRSVDTENNGKTIYACFPNRTSDELHRIRENVAKCRVSVDPVTVVDMDATCEGKVQEALQSGKGFRENTVTHLYSRLYHWSHWHAMFVPHGLMQLRVEHRELRRAVAKVLQLPTTEDDEKNKKLITVESLLTYDGEFIGGNSSLSRKYYDLILGSHCEKPIEPGVPIFSEFSAMGKLDCTVHVPYGMAKITPQCQEELKGLRVDLVKSLVTEYGDAPDGSGRSTTTSSAGSHGGGGGGGSNSGSLQEGRRPVVLYDKRPFCMDVLDRFRGIRPSVEKHLVNFIQASVGNVNTIKIDNSVTFGDQFKLIRGSKYILLGEGAGLANMLLSRPGTTWIIVYDHWRSDTWMQSEFHVPTARALGIVKLIFVNIYFHRVPPMKDVEAEILRTPWKPGVVFIGANEDGKQSNEEELKNKPMNDYRRKTMKEALELVNNTWCKDLNKNF